MGTNEVYTTGNIAKFCNVKKMTVIRWIERGELPAHHLPGRGDRRVTRKDLLAFFKKNGFPLPVELQTTGARILVVDDDPALAKAICLLLRNEGYQTDIATDGFRAGALLERFKPGLVTLDLSMPGISGYEVLSFIRGHESLKSIKVLVVSALEDDRLRAALEAGADDVLKKPFQLHELREKVHKLIPIASSAYPS